MYSPFLQPPKHAAHRQVTGGPGVTVEELGPGEYQITVEALGPGVYRITCGDGRVVTLEQLEIPKPAPTPGGDRD